MKRVLALTALFAATVVLTGRVPAQGPGMADPPFKKDDVWKGPLTQIGKYKTDTSVPAEFTCEFKITALKNKDMEFDAQLKETAGKLEVTYLVSGKLTAEDNGFSFTFTSSGVAPDSVKRTEPLTGITYTGKITGKEMNGTWEYKKMPEDTDLSGTVKFKKQ